MLRLRKISVYKWRKRMLRGYHKVFQPIRLNTNSKMKHSFSLEIFDIDSKETFVMYATRTFSYPSDDLTKQYWVLLGQ